MLKMKNGKKMLAAAMSAAMMLSCTAALLPAGGMTERAVLTASAAEADYDWSGFLKKDAGWFGTSEAVKIADECIQYQVANEGGWQKGMLTSHTGDWAHSTIDNDATTSQIRFLMRTYAQTGQQKYLECAMRGVDCLFKMQYSSGGWMQCLNTPGTYHAHITLNDGAYVHVLQIMLDMSKKAGDFTAVSDAYAQKAQASLEKGIQCLLDMQISVNGVKTAWCQQHDKNNLKPAGARAYELPSICTSESAGVVTFLYNYAKANPERTDIIQAVNAAIKWFQDVTLTGIEFVKDGDDKVVRQNPNASPVWARFYTLDTQVPLFSDRDGGTYYDVMQISKERRTGYAWYGNWGKNIVNLALLPEDGEIIDVVQTYLYYGSLIGELAVRDQGHSGSWSIEQNLQVGSTIYGDRNYTVSELPVAQGAEYIRPACDSKGCSGELADLTAAADISLYIFMDRRVVEGLGENLLTSWLKDYTRLRTTVGSSNGEIFEVFVRDLSKGEKIVLGSNFTAKDCVNYFAAAVKREAETTTAEMTTTTVTTTETAAETTEATTVTESTPAPETTTTTTTTVTSISETVPPEQEKPDNDPGDVDCTGSVDVSDAVLLARYIAEDGEAFISMQGKANAECDGEAGLNSGDVTMILKYIAKIVTQFPV